MPANLTTPEIIMAYWQGFTPSGAGPQDSPTLEQTPEFVDIIALAFGVILPQNSITTDFLTSKNSKQSILDGTRFLQARGQKVVMSINGNPKYSWDKLEPKPFAKAVKDIVIDEWGLDGVDLDNEYDEDNPEKPGLAFAAVTHAIRETIGAEKLITYPAYMPDRDNSYLQAAKDDLDFISTMAYWNGSTSQIKMYEGYASIMGYGKVAIGVKPGYQGSDQSTPIDAVPALCKYEPKKDSRKRGMMLYSLTIDVPQYTKLPKFAWTNMVQENLRGAGELGKAAS
jgi:chitinase